MLQTSTRTLVEQRSNPMLDPIDLAIQRGAKKLASLQDADGAWRGDYGGPMFLLPMYVAACYIAKHPIAERRRAGMIAYLQRSQNTDGSIGLHVEAPGGLFTTVLCYIALRLLGVPPEASATERMCRWIRANGTALGCASWGKFILSLLNLYDYEGLHPVLPELWLLPFAAPIHPGRLWCHCRQVYLPMAYLYGTRAHIPVDDVIEKLRREIYDRPYDAIVFREHRDTLATCDSHVSPSVLLDLVNRAMDLYERVHRPGLRRRSLEVLFDHIAYEDRVTNFIRIGPVNAVLNTLVHSFRDPGGKEEQQSFTALEQYLWDGPDGTKMNGYNSTALWDTTFAVQAILATPFADQHKKVLARAHTYIRENQVTSDVPDRARYFRHASRGGWPFSDRLHGWPITDCTAEGLKSALALETSAAPPVPEEFLEESVRLLLGFQNNDGGWATYERQRAGRWLEHLNPSQVFNDIMVDTSYVECTSACIQALAVARARFPGRFDDRIDRALRRGARFIRRQQRPDGSFTGSWAVCFTYGTWFAVWGLMASGASSRDPAIRRAGDFLCLWQNADGGWGEHFLSCRERRYVPCAESHAVNTAWALLALTRAGLGYTEAARRAAQFLLETQLEDGDWPSRHLVGVFNRTVLINYENYRRYFPLWALASFRACRAN